MDGEREREWILPGIEKARERKSVSVPRDRVSRGWGKETGTRRRKEGRREEGRSGSAEWYRVGSLGSSLFLTSLFPLSFLLSPPFLLLPQPGEDRSIFRADGCAVSMEMGLVELTVEMWSWWAPFKDLPSETVSLFSLNRTVRSFTMELEPTMTWRPRFETGVLSVIQKKYDTLKTDGCAITAEDGPHENRRLRCEIGEIRSESNARAFPSRFRGAPFRPKSGPHGNRRPRLKIGGCNLRCRTGDGFSFYFMYFILDCSFLGSFISCFFFLV